MPEKKRSRLSRFFGFLLFRIMPVLLVLGILSFSYNIVGAVARHIGEQREAEARGALYRETLTAILPTLTTETPIPTATSTSTSTPTVTPTFTDTPSPSPTLTPTPSFTSTNTATATHTASPTATNTDQPVVVAQAFVTNTPRPAAVMLPPLNTPIPTAIPTEAASLTPTPTFTETVTPTFTFTPPPPATQTPRPLPTLFAPAQPDPNAVAVTAIPTQVPTVDRHGYDIVNILLMGGDDQITNDGTVRTDTMIIVSVNRTTNTVAMLSLPRDLFVYIPGWTMQRLNLAYEHGELIGWQPDGGWGLMRQTIFYNLGINVHYYALINLGGFKEIIDTMGGIDVAVDCAIQDLPLVEAPPPPEAYKIEDDGTYVLPVGYYHMDGGSALWYARSRSSSSDFDRGRRQMQILRAIWRAGRSGGQITQLPELWSQFTQVVKTNLSFEDMLGLLPLALNLDPGRIDHFYMQKPYHTTPWQPPDGSNVQLPNYDAVRQLMEDFYQPPTESQIAAQSDSIVVYNGTTNETWDRVAAERLAWDSFNATAGGTADHTNYVDTILIDHTGETKGSNLQDIARILNVKTENIRIEPDPNRTADYEVILGSSYNSCTFSGILPVATPSS